MNGSDGGGLVRIPLELNQGMLDAMLAAAGLGLKGMRRLGFGSRILAAGRLFINSSVARNQATIDDEIRELQQLETRLRAVSGKIGPPCIAGEPLSLLLDSQLAMRHALHRGLLVRRKARSGDTSAMVASVTAWIMMVSVLLRLLLCPSLSTSASHLISVRQKDND